MTQLEAGTNERARSAAGRDAVPALGAVGAGLLGWWLIRRLLVRRKDVAIDITLTRVDASQNLPRVYGFYESEDIHVQPDNLLNCNEAAGYDLFFRIKRDDTGQDLRFVLPPEPAIWVEKNGSCPPTACSVYDEVIGQGKETKANPKHLRVKNFNIESAHLSYALRFRSGKDRTIYLLDPVIKNGGGGNVF